MSFSKVHTKIQKLKHHWGIRSNFQIILIFIAFAINGSLAIKLAEPIMNFLHLQKDTTNPFIYWFLKIVLIFPIYQITLIFVGAGLGQFTFFWNLEKKLLMRIGFKRFFKNK